MRLLSEVATRLNSVRPESFWRATVPRQLPAKSFTSMADTRSWGCSGRSFAFGVALSSAHQNAKLLMDLYLELVSLLGPDVVSRDPVKLEENSQDKWFASHLPDVVVEPTCTEQISRLLRFASQWQIPVTARGAGYGYVGGCVPVKGGIVLSLARMNRIKEIAVADGVAVVEPGVITGDLQREVKNCRLFYPPDPASLKNSSIGGNIATNAGGPRCLKYGVTRHYVLGLEVVLANGTVVRVGGRTHKNKTGFDLVGLFVGSEGMLGIVTEATLRLLPFPPARGSISSSFSSIEDAATAVQEILLEGYLPSALEIADGFTLEAARQHLARRIVPDGEAHLLIDLDGQEDVGTVRNRGTFETGKVARCVDSANVHMVKRRVRSFGI